MTNFIKCLKKHFLLSGILIVIVSGCVKGLMPSRNGGPVSISIKSGHSGGISSKTSYGGSGAVWNGSERINWSLNDRLIVVSDECSGSPCEYIVEKVETSSLSGAHSIARVKPYNSGGLAWGDSGLEHHFYTLYPSPTFSPSSSLVNIATTQTAGTNTGCNYSFYIPSDQVLSKDSGYPSASATDTLRPDMRYAYLWGAAATAGVQNSLNLSLSPAFMALQFSVEGDGVNTITLNSFKVTSVASALSGSYSGNLSVSVSSGISSTFGIPATSTSNAIAGFTFPANITLTPDGNEIVFTVFCLPGSINDMVIEFNLNYGSGDISKKLALKYSNEDPFVFSGTKKYSVKGLTLPVQTKPVEVGIISVGSLDAIEPDVSVVDIRIEDLS